MRKIPGILLLTGLILLLAAGCTGGLSSEGDKPTGAEVGPDATVYPDPDSGNKESCRITVFNVGKADSMLIQNKGYNILIDTGEYNSASLIIDKLKKLDAVHLDLVVITHFDKDHVGGAPLILENEAITFDEVIYPDYSNNKSTYFSFRRFLEDYNIEGKINERKDYVFGDMTLKIYPAEDPEKIRKKSDSYDNDMSMICLLCYDGHQFLFMGDAEKERLKEFLSNKEFKKDAVCEWIKMPHHGDNNKRTDDLIDLCKPAYAIITDSVNEPAKPATIEKLKEENTEIFESIYGDIVTQADQNGIRVWYDNGD